MTDAYGPATKRRKLLVYTADAVAPPYSTYIQLAGCCVELNEMSEDFKDLVTSPQGTFHVTLKTASRTTPGDNEIKIELGVTGKRSSVTAITSAIRDEYDVQLLVDAVRAESTAKPIGKHGRPVICQHAVLRKGPDRMQLDLSLLCEDFAPVREAVSALQIELLRRYLPSEHAANPATLPESWQPRDFYDNVHVPEKTADNNSDFAIDGFESSLYPFQRRTVKWMLSREGVSVDANGRVQKIKEAGDLPHGFVKCYTSKGRPIYVDHALGVVSSDVSKIQAAFQTVRRGLLADEMGLGKTLGVIATVCLHRRADIDTSVPKTGPQKSGATLIITPPTILEQWKAEIAEHAPHLEVLHYEGLKASKADFKQIVARLASSDIVLTTYNVISKEVHYVAEKPDRSMRNRPRADPPKSPLTEISFWRVCLDEAQMVESGVSAAATVARLIPREIAWAVTGTPLRKGHKDLYGLMLFLKVQPWCHSPRLWDYLLSYYRPRFRDLMGQIAIRHSKDYVREDLRLPPQSRHTITLPFTAVEDQHYEHLFNEMCEEVGLDSEGGPREEHWDPQDPTTVEQMRRWLTRLRQTCLHPEVGARNRKALGRQAGPLRTVQQVLDVMIEQNESSMRTEQRNLLMSQVRRGQMQENAKSTKDALGIWQESFKEACRIVDECRDQLKQEAQSRAALKNEEAAKDPDHTEDENEEDAEADTGLQTYKQRLRSALEVKHICIFFMANAYFQLKSDETEVKPESEEFHAWEKQETEAYDDAKKVRGELLTEVLRKANRYIKLIRDKATADTLAHLPILEAPDDYTGIESRKIFDKLHSFCEDLNTQRKYFLELRQKMVDFLRQALIDEDEGVELQGDEYESSTKHQDEMYAYMEALRAHFADRSDAISGQENLLIRQEMKQFLRSAKDGEGPAPELMLQLLAEREQVRIDINKKGSLRGIIAEIRQLVTALQWQEAGGSVRARAELVIANRILQHAQQLVSMQTKSLTNLEQEVNMFRDTMNSRLDYYRALQKISDTVAPYDEENIDKPLDVDAFHRLKVAEGKIAIKLSTLVSKRRYLLHLKNESSSQTPRICIICQCEFEIGTLTVCGHQFCKECIQLWWSEHRNCPVCKKRLHTSDFHDITYKPAEMAVQGDAPPSPFDSPGSADSSLTQSIYSDISIKTLHEIKNIELEGASFGSKVDMLTRHILWLRDHDPGTKAIVFSQYREFLDVLGRAMKQHKISFSAFDDKNGIEKFKSDPSIECFLLHAKAHSAGLNLVVASHVFLCEPMLATAVELQAIARVHRIGQHRATTVWMYVIGGTVEEAIYEMSVTRRLAHIKRSDKGKSRATSSKTSGTTTPNGTNLQETAIDLANSLELQAADLSRLLASGKMGGELVDQDDLWQCLFGKVKRTESVLAGAAGQTATSQMDKFLRAEAAADRAA